ncbi:MAG: penicillin-binding protein 1C [Deltaproteobacteria bacterium]|nr:penicillin-binding protein 1C [Deltaproteobacteria bacterium]
MSEQVGYNRLAKAAVLLALGVFLSGLAAQSFKSLLPVSGALPSFRTVRESHRPSEGVLLDRHGVPLQEVRSDFQRRILPWVSFSDVSPSLIAAVLRSEDKRFYGHPGVDGLAVVSAAAGNLLHGGRRGASTITMQLVSLLDGSGKKRKGAGRILAKVLQARLALRLEREWTKDEILEAYLNRVTFRGELQGIAAATRGMFDKDPSGLDAAESAVLASLIRSPNASPFSVGRRAALLCSALGWTVSDGTLESIARERLHAPFSVNSRHVFAFHAARILVPGAGERIVSTLDLELQRKAAVALSQQVGMLSAQNVHDGAVLVAENSTGDILAYVGGTGSFSQSPFVDGVRARRQAGSTLKPFLYGLAIEQRILTAASLMDDSPLDVPTERGLYVPRNYDREFRGTVTLRTSLASSLNVPAVRSILLLGPDAVARRLAAFGFDLTGGGEDYGASLALGSADVTLFELVNSYRALANGGRWSPMTLRLEEKRRNSRKAMSPEAAFIVSDILSDRGARGAAFGLASPLSTSFRAAVKTGTSKDMRDNWCVGFSDRYTVGVWVGNFGGAPMWDVSGLSGAAPVWREVMAFLHEGIPARPAAPPSGIVSRRVEFPGGIESARDEWFIAGTEPVRDVKSAMALLPPRITYPSEGTVVALDPDIPVELQRIFFDARGADREMSWRLDGQTLGKAGDPISWRPQQGTHTLEIISSDGHTADSVRFHIRGRLPESARNTSMN